jgi:hypothetical protein
MPLTDEEMIARMAMGWARGNMKAESQCGNGSRVSATGPVRQWLSNIHQEYNVKSVSDVGAGDLNWIGLVDWNVQYRGYDVYPRHEDVEYFDGTKDVLPKCDLILCRQVMIHLPEDRVYAMLDNFKLSGSKYLAATTWDDPATIDWDAPYHHVDLRPYLGDYIEKVNDTSNVSFLALWRLN